MNLFRNIFLILFTVCVFALSGCSSFFGSGDIFRDKKGDYVEAKELDALKIPDDLFPVVMLPDMQIPELGEGVQAKYFANEPPRVTVAKGAEQEEESKALELKKSKKDNYKVVTTTQGTQLVAKDSIDQMWECMQSFWKKLQVPLAKVDQKLYVLESSWINSTHMSEASTAKKSKPPTSDSGKAIAEAIDEDERGRFRIKIVLKNRQTIVIVKSISRNIKDTEESVNWSDVEGYDGHLEGVLLREFVKFLPSCIKTPAQKKDKANLDLDEYIKPIAIDSDTKELAIVLDTSFSDAWEQVKDALPKTDIKSTDVDRSSGVFFVDVTISDKMILDSQSAELAKGKNTKDEKLANLLGKKSYLLRVKDGGNDKSIIYLEKNGKPVSDSESRVILADLLTKGQLIVDSD